MPLNTVLLFCICYFHILSVPIYYNNYNIKLFIHVLKLHRIILQFWDPYYEGNQDLYLKLCSSSPRSTINYGETLLTALLSSDHNQFHPTPRLNIFLHHPQTRGCPSYSLGDDAGHLHVHPPQSHHLLH